MNLDFRVETDTGTGGPHIKKENKTKEDRVVGPHLLPRMGLDLRKLELGVVGVHLADLLARRRAQHLDDLHQLVDARVARKDGLAQQQFGQHATGAPNVCEKEEQKKHKKKQLKSVSSHFQFE